MCCAFSAIPRLRETNWAVTACRRGAGMSPSPAVTPTWRTTTAGLQILNVSEPATPTLVATLDTPGLARAVALSGTHVLVADSLNGLQIIDASQPAFPQVVGAVDTPGQAVDLALTPGYAYVADESGGLRAIGLTPAPAELVRACDSAGHCTTVVGTTSSCSWRRAPPASRC
jgi:hypothetical protein